MLIVGLTGGIACGKTTFIQALIEQDPSITNQIIDCDELVRQTQKEGRWGYRRTLEAMRSIGYRKDAITDPETGELDRQALADIIYDDPVARKAINRATHLPVALLLLRRVLVNWLLLRPFTIVDMPLLFETGSERFCESTIVVGVERETQLRRLMARDRIDREFAESKLKAQLPLDLKMRRATVVVMNEGRPSELRDKAKAVLRDIRGRAGGRLKALLFSPYAICGAVWGVQQLMMAGLTRRGWGPGPNKGLKG